jgi:hypothetical protein
VGNQLAVMFAAIDSPRILAQIVYLEELHVRMAAAQGFETRDSGGKRNDNFRQSRARLPLQGGHAGPQMSRASGRRGIAGNSDYYRENRLFGNAQGASLPYIG